MSSPSDIRFRNGGVENVRIASGGNLGLGTTSPGAKLSFSDLTSSAPDGITWWNASPLLYGIYKTSGSWTGPDYQQLKLVWDTGIILDPGTSYGKSYVDVRGNGLRINEGTASPINSTGLFQLNYSSNQAFKGALIKNSNAGNYSYSEITMYNNIDQFGQLFFTGSNYSANPAVKPNAAGLYSGGSGGISFLAGDAAAPITFGTSNTNRMIIDPAGNVGIGTMTPNAAYKLDVAGTINATNILVNGQPISGGSSQWATNGTAISYAAGNVGIGTTTPSSKLGVYNPGNKTEVIIGNPSTASGGFTSLLMGTSADTNGFGYIEAVKSSGTAYGDVIISRYGGNVGVGITQTDAKLTVNGTVHSKEVKVDLNVPAPDYVFEKDYHLMSLEETKAYIDVNKHLPEVPSAKEMEKNGVQLGEMNLLLLKKVEELTLHLIDQQNKINEQELRIKTLEKRLEK